MSGDHEYASETEQASYREVKVENVGYIPTIREPVKRRRKGPRSLLWRKFTIVDSEKCVASCDICSTLMSFKSTTSNLKNHLIRKHKYDIKTSSYIKSQSNIAIRHNPQPRVTAIERKNSTHQAFRPRVSQVSTIDDLVFDVVVGEEEEAQHGTVRILPDQVVEEPIEADDCSEYTFTTQQTSQETYSVQTDTPEARQETHKTYQSARPECRKIDPGERNKRQKILDLQLECLEMKKYNMQIETLMMEQQMNLPRSIFTETLRGSHTFTRSTQTDVGGDKTKVFYLSNKNGEAVHHFISLQDPDN